MEWREWPTLLHQTKEDKNLKVSTVFGNIEVTFARVIRVESKERLPGGNEQMGDKDIESKISTEEQGARLLGFTS